MKYTVNVNGKRYDVEVEKAENYTAPQTASPPPAPAIKPEVAEDIKVIAPLPGTILDIKCAVGQAVNQGDVLIVIESMKMETEIAAPSPGAVNQILTSKSAMVDPGDLLIILR